MIQPKTQIREIIAEQRYITDPAVLSSLAKERFHQRPVLYGTLIYVSKILAEEQEPYSGQGLPLARHRHIEKRLTVLLLDAIDAESADPKDLLEKLDAVHSAVLDL